jgi:type II secretory ATPase GspE/PulE/Tfp pilus assembly ATPase PilB-like protein
MLSSEGKQIDTETTRQRMFTSLQTHLPPGTDHEQMFMIMEGVLSFEVCLYHKLLPIGIEENNILIGMVYPDDEDALDYIGRILSYLQLKMVVQSITDEAHRATMSAYLNYRNTFPVTTHKHPSIEKLLAESRTAVEVKSTGLDEGKDEDISQQSSVIAPQAVILDSIEQLSSKLTTETDITLSNPNCLIPLRITSDADATSIIEIPKVFSPVEALVNLPSKKILEELLGRILAGGIGRLYLERQSDQGRILWSDNGVLQSVLDKLPIAVFQGVIDELKQITNLHKSGIMEVQQAEREFLCQQKRLLLRLRVMPNSHGQEATLQVLRGAALKFYQQQKLTHLSRSTIETIKQLSKMLHELQNRLMLDTDPTHEQLAAIRNLNRLMERIDQETKILAAQNLPSENS